MKLFACLLVFHMILSKAFTEPSTSIQIQNYDGPIYLHAPTTCNEDSSKMLHISKDHCYKSRICDTDCTCVSRTSPKCVPINTASESSCCTGYGHPYCPQDTVYYTVESQWSPNCPIVLESPIDYTRDRNHCCKCTCCYNKVYN